MHILYWILLLFIFTPAMAQVNTEVLRKDMGNGWHAGLSADLTINDGNSEFLRLKTGARIDYQHNALAAFLIGDYQRGLKDGALFINKGFLHARLTQVLLNRLQGEWFFQKAFNDFINLQSRDLVGSGLRWQALNRRGASGETFVAFIGIGAMYEHEKLDEKGNNVSTEQLRSTNYLSVRWIIDDRLQLRGIGYYQQSLENGADYRMLAECSLGFNLTRRVIFRTSLNYRYDNEPPAGIESFDLELTNGIDIEL